MFAVAKSLLQDFPDDKLQAAIERKEGRLLSDVTRLHLAEALNEFALAGKHDLREMLHKHWPQIDRRVRFTISRRTALSMTFTAMPCATMTGTTQKSSNVRDSSLARRHACSGFWRMSSIQSARDHSGQDQIAAKLNPILRRDGYCLIRSGRISGTRPMAFGKPPPQSFSPPISSSRRR